jgi:hypothetical protein
LTSLADGPRIETNYLPSRFLLYCYMPTPLPPPLASLAWRRSALAAFPGPFDPPSDCPFHGVDGRGLNPSRLAPPTPMDFPLAPRRRGSLSSPHTADLISDFATGETKEVTNVEGYLTVISRGSSISSEAIPMTPRTTRTRTVSI